MKNFFYLLLCLLVFACSGPNEELELKEIRVKKRGGEIELVKKLHDLKSFTDTSNRLEIAYQFRKKNIKNLKSGLLQVDNNAFFKLYLNDNLIVDRSSAFFMDTLLSSKKDSFIYSDSLCFDYFIRSSILKNNILSGENKLLIQFQNQKYYRLNHEKTQLFLSKNNNDYPNKSPKKSLKKSNLPWISINTKKGIKDEPKLSAELSVKEGEIICKEKIQIEIRGNTSQSFKKKSYSFLFLDEDNQTKKVSLMNLPMHEHWVLYGPYADKSLMRNVLAYRLFENMGHYAPRTKFCELSINGFYQGVYVLCEKIRVASTRLELKDGYLLKIDRPKSEFFKSNITNDKIKKIVFEIKYPDGIGISVEEKNAVENFVHLFEETLFLSDVNNLSIFEMIDMNSFIDFLIINEFCKNIDAYRLSTYFQISKEKRVVMGPIWDFNFSFGLTDYLDGYSTSGFVYEHKAEVPFWWKKLNENIFFKSALKKRWNQLRQSILSEKAILEMVNKYAKKLEVSQKNNFSLWNLLGQKEVWPNYYIGNSHEEEVVYLRNWVLERGKWLDKKWGN